MPEPPLASSWPDQLTVKLVAGSVVAGSAATLLVGRPGVDGVGTRAVFSGALVSKTTDACWLMVVPVVRPALGWTVYWT